MRLRMRGSCGGFPKIGGAHFGGLHKEDSSILGCMLGPSIYGHFHLGCQCLVFRTPGLSA